MTLGGYLRLIGPLAALALVIVAGVQTKRANDYAARDAAHQACAAAIDAGRTVVDVSVACDPAISLTYSVASQSKACDAALKPLDLYGVRAACSAPVKALQADHAAQVANAGDLRRQLTAERAGRQAAILRAAAAATTETERKARAAAALKAAPRDGSGLVVCDAQCMRDRWGGADAERP